MPSHAFKRTRDGFVGVRLPPWAIVTSTLAIIIALISAYLACHGNVAMIPITVVAIAIVVGLRLGTAIELVIDSHGVRERGTEIRWDEPHDLWSSSVALMRRGQVARTIDKLRITTNDGRTIVIEDGYGRTAETASTTFVRAASMRAQLPRFRALPVATFGPISLTRDQTLVRGTPIDREARLVARNGLMFLDRGGHATPTGISVTEVPNLGVLLALQK